MIKGFRKSFRLTNESNNVSHDFVPLTDVSHVFIHCDIPLLYKLKICDFEYRFYGCIDAILNINSKWHTNHSENDFKNLTNSIAFEKLPEYLDGRFFIIKSSTNDSSFQIEADRFGKYDIYFRSENGKINVSNSFYDLAHNDDEFDFSSIAQTISIYGNRPPKRQSYLKAVKRLGIGDRLTYNGATVSIQNNFSIKNFATPFIVQGY